MRDNVSQPSNNGRVKLTLSQTHRQSFYIVSFIGFMQQEAHGTKLMRMGTRTKELNGMLQTLAQGTGKRLDPATFVGRLRIQKSVFLLKAQSHTLSSSYRFNLYVRGPYSRDLARDYYEIIELDPEPRPVVVPDEMLSVVREAMDGGDAFLEAVASVLSIHETNSPEADREMVIRIACRLKPQLSHHYDSAWTFLERKGLV